MMHSNGSESLCKYLGNPLPGGSYVVETYKGSPFEKAGVKAGDMVYKIDGYDVDLYGEICVPWSEDKVSVSDYVSRLKVGAEVKVLVYRKGKRKELKVLFDEMELLPVRVVYPSYEDIDYENIGGMVIMPLFLNHIPMYASIYPKLARYTQTKYQVENALIVTHICPNSQAHRSLALGRGIVIDKVNEQRVETLEEFRNIVKSAIGRDAYVIIETDDGVKAALPLKAMIDETEKLSRTYRYPLTPFVQECLELSHQKFGKIIQTS